MKKKQYIYIHTFILIEKGKKERGRGKINLANKIKALIFVSYFIKF